MKSLKDHGLEHDDWIYIHSEICSIAETLGNLKSGYEIKNRLWELSASYYNQWRFVLDSYKRLYEIFIELNEKSTEWSGNNVLSNFDFFLLRYEPEIRIYSYLFIISLKSLLDLLVCIIDLIQNREIREEHKLPDFFNYYKKKSKNIKSDIPELKDYLDLIRNEIEWVDIVKSVRDRIIHRGYLLKPVIGFSKIENLIIKTYKGADFYSDTMEIDIGNIMSELLNDIKDIESEVTKILLSNMPDLKEVGLTHKSKFRFAELWNEYSVEQIKQNR